jgi:hypothetical protein
MQVAEQWRQRRRAFGESSTGAIKALCVRIALSSGAWLYDARAFAPPKAPILIGHFPTRPACQQAKRE